VTEVPEQTGLEAPAVADVPQVRSMRRRIRAMAEERGLSIDVHSAVSRDLLRTVHDETRRAQCEWLVLRWQGRGRQQLLPHNPLGWLVNHLDANLALYRDAGVRYVRKILVYAEPGPNDALVVHTAEHLASIWKAKVTLGRFAPSSASPTELQAETDYLEQLGQLSEREHGTAVLRGTDPVETVSEATASYDLVVLGARDHRFVQTLRGSFQDRIAARAACSVLIVKSARVKTHEAYDPSSGGEELSFSNLLRPAAVGARLDVNRKEALFEQLADHLAKVVPGVSTRQISDALWARERTQNTAVGNGVALPHATVAEASRSVLAVFTSAKGVQYLGPDRAECDIFFVTLGPPSERERHLKVLSGIARLCMQTDVIAGLRAAESGDAVRTTFESCIKQLDA
jgi:basic amino acid/polyamine antiporter, APA family